MYVIHTNLQFWARGSIEQDSNRSTSAVFALFQRGPDAKIFCDYMWAVWKRAVRTWDSTRDRWNDLTQEQLASKPSTVLTQATYYEGWPKRFGISTGLFFDKTTGKWRIEQGQPEITAVFRRLDDARAYAEFIEKILSAKKIEVPDDIRPQVVQFSTPPEWIQVEDPAIEVFQY